VVVGGIIKNKIMTEQRTKQNFYVTFGVQYAGGNHPVYPKADCNGWVRIVADDYEKARVKAFEMFGRCWSNIRTESDWKPEYFPMGEIECVEV
jgi:hypothetical protein